MIEAKDLRVGNLLQGKNVVTVEAILSNKAVMIKGNITRFHVYAEPPYEPCLSPIPLTEDWLWKFGFKLTNITGFDIIKNGVMIEILTPPTGIEFLLNHYNTPIKHVHQLQNLYFALTGEELIIKEDETTKKKEEAS